MQHCTKEQLIAFERRMADLWEAGDLPFLLHLSGGNEDQLIEIFRQVQPGDWVFSTHRNHYHALLSGMPEPWLEQLIRQGDSMFVFSNPAPGEKRCEVNFLSSSILAGTCAIAAGVAWDIKRSGGQERVWCFLGDGAEDEGHFYEAVRFVSGHRLPCAFIIEDNNRQVETDSVTRHGRPYPGSFEDGIYAAGVVRRYYYQPTYPHAGSGCKHQITFNPNLKPQ